MTAWPDTDEARSRAARRERVLRQALHDVVARKGLPRDWLSCQTLVAVRTAGRMPGFHVQLIVNRGWDLLKRQLPELEQAFRQCALALDRSSADWIFSVAWVFDEPQRASAPAGWMVGGQPDAAQRPRLN